MDWQFYYGSKRKIEDVLLEHVGLPHDLHLTVHLRSCFAGRGDHYEPFLLFECFLWDPSVMSFMLKSYGGWVVGGVGGLQDFSVLF